MVVIQFTHDLTVDQENEVCFPPDDFQLVAAPGPDRVASRPIHKVQPLAIHYYRNREKLTVSHTKPVVIPVILDPENEPPAAVGFAASNMFAVGDQMKIRDWISDPGC